MLDILAMILLVSLFVDAILLAFIRKVKTFFLWLILVILTFTVFITTHELDELTREHAMTHKEYHEQNPD